MHPIQLLAHPKTKPSYLQLPLVNMRLAFAAHPKFSSQCTSIIFSAQSKRQAHREIGRPFHQLPRAVVWRGSLREPENSMHSATVMWLGSKSSVQRSQ